MVMKVAVIIVNYNGRNHLFDCLASLISSISNSHLDVDIFMVDNKSTDESVQFVQNNFPQVITICLEKNIGFGAAVNEVIRFIANSDRHYEYFLIVTPDTKFERSFLETIIEEAQSLPRFGAASPLLLKWDGKTVDSAGASIGLLFGFAWPGKIFGDCPFSAVLTHLKPFEVFYASGAVLLVKAAVARVVMFEPTYFLYCEDVDFCWRIRMLGYAIYCIPKAVTYHKVSAITKGSGNPMNYYYSQKNELTTIFKNLETKNILKYFIPSLFIHLFLRLLIVQYQFFSGKRLAAYLTIKAWFAFFFNLKLITRKRHETQAMRKVPDSEILKLAFRKPLTHAWSVSGDYQDSHTE
jgi:GT2 family glycosyltransferase